MAARREKPFEKRISKNLLRFLHDIWTMHAKWHVFLQLFDREDSVAVLSRVSPFAAMVIRDAVLDEMVLAIWQIERPAENDGPSQFDGKTDHRRR